MATKRALCVGINKYAIPGNDLWGCVNDAVAWAGLLQEKFEFPAANVKTLLDAEATKANILGALTTMLDAAQPGDVVAFTNSSHGSYRPDTDGDEPMYDELLCPHDIDKNEIVDDELYDLFQKHLKVGVHFTVVLDNCYSGTGTRIAGSDQRTERFLDPTKIKRFKVPDDFDIALARNRGTGARPESEMKEVLLSGCRDVEVSWDAQIGGKFQGAMSQAAIEAIREAHTPLTYRQLHAKVLQKIKANGFDQHPQLEGNEANKDREILT